MKKRIMGNIGFVLAVAISLLMLPTQTVKAENSLFEKTVTSVAVPTEDYLYNAEYYAKANEDVAVALNGDPDKLYQHWLEYGKAEGRNASMVFNAKYYLEKNPSVAAKVGNDYVKAYEHFVSEGLLAGLESSPVFSVKYYLQANQDVAQAFNGDYVSAAKHFNLNAIAEGRSGSGNFDYTVYRACNTDVEELYGDYIEGYYIHYINHGRAEGRTGGLAASGSGSEGGTTGGNTGNIEIDTSAVSYRIFDEKFYLAMYPELEKTVGTDKNALYQYWMDKGISQGQTASPVIIPGEYMALNTDVAEAFQGDSASAIRHFLNNGIEEGRTGSYAFDYTIYAYCNTDVAEVFGEDKVGYYAHYVQHGIAEGRTAQPESFEVELSDEDGRIYKLSFDDGQNTAQSCYDAEGTLLGSAKIKYNENGSINKVAFYDAAEEYAGDIYYFYYGTGELSQYSVTTNAEVNYAVLTDGVYEFYKIDRDTYRYVYFNIDGAVNTEQTNWKNGLPKLLIYFSKYGMTEYYEFSEEGYTEVHILYSYENGEPSGSTKWEFEYMESCQDNKVIKKTLYYGDGSIWCWTESHYDDAGEYTGYHQYKADGTLDYYMEREYTENGYVERQYFANGNLWTVEKYENGIVVDYTRYDYDADGKLSCYIKEEKVYEDGVLKEERMSEYELDGTLRNMTSIEYENGTRWSKQSRYGADGILQSYTTYVYKDANSNRWYRENHHNEKGELVYYVLIDENGTRTEYWE